MLLLGLLLAAGCCSGLAHGAQVYMEFNGQHYAYNTDEAAALRISTSDLSPNYQLPERRQLRQRTQWGWLPPVEHARPVYTQHNINFSTQHMSHRQHTDESGIVVGRYSYYDAAGYHELSYKAGAGIGFVVMGGNLARPTEQRADDSLHSY